MFNGMKDILNLTREQHMQNEDKTQPKSLPFMIHNDTIDLSCHTFLHTSTKFFIIFSDK